MNGILQVNILLGTNLDFTVIQKQSMYVYTLSKKPLPSAMLKIFALQFNYSCNQLHVTKSSLLLYMSTSFINEIFSNIIICGNTLILEKIYLNYVILVHCYKTVTFVSLRVFYVYIFILTIKPILYSKQTSYLNNLMRSILNSTRLRCSVTYMTAGTCI